MFGMTTALVRVHRNRLRPVLNILRSSTQSLAPARAFATGFARRTGVAVGSTGTRLLRKDTMIGSAMTLVRTVRRAFAPIGTAATGVLWQAVVATTANVVRLLMKELNMTTTMPGTDAQATPVRSNRDLWRQALNLLLAIAQFAAAAIIFSSDFGNELFYNPNTRNPLIVPADYTFSIWGFIFPASIAYGIYQALPQQRDSDLLRRIGWQTAFAFLCITLWSVATLLDPIRYTVPLFFGALFGLIYALYQISRRHTLTFVERLFVVVPLSVYAAWCTVGTIANTSTSLFALGYTDPIFREQTWAVMMLLVAGMISSFMTTVAKGNIPYGLGIIWALIGVVVANVMQTPNTAVAVTAAGMAALVVLALIRARVTTKVA
jgi:hypothetical protein